MQEVAVAGGWISIWLSPVATLLLDAVFAILLVTLVNLCLKALRRAHPKNGRPGA
jgi:hypothetical protein